MGGEIMGFRNSLVLKKIRCHGSTNALRNMIYWRAVPDNCRLVEKFEEEVRQRPWSLGGVHGAKNNGLGVNECLYQGPVLTLLLFDILLWLWASQIAGCNSGWTSLYIPKKLIPTASWLANASNILISMHVNEIQELLTYLRKLSFVH